MNHKNREMYYYAQMWKKQGPQSVSHSRLDAVLGGELERSCRKKERGEGTVTIGAVK
jgi:hypothetical protein